MNTIIYIEIIHLHDQTIQVENRFNKVAGEQKKRDFSRFGTKNRVSQETEEVVVLICFTFS